MRPEIFRARTLVPISSPPRDNGALVVRARRIVAVGDFPALRHAYPDAPVRDFGEAILLPPLSNAHTHLELTHFPRWATTANQPPPGGEFTDWLLTVIGVKRRLSLDQLHESLRAGVRAALQSGTAVVGDNLSRFESLGLLRRSPLLGRVYLEAIGRSESGCTLVMDELTRLFDQGDFGALEAGIAPHAPYTVAPDFMSRLAAFAAERRATLSLHIAESAAEVRLCQEGDGPLVERVFPLADWPAPPALGLSPVALLERSGLLGPGSLLVHGVHVDAADIALVAARGSAVVLCPRSNRRLGVGTAPAAAYLAAGVPLALGTDSLASNDSLSLWDELACAASIYADQLDPGTLLRMATWQGAQLLGAGEECGALRPGFGANFLVLEGEDVGLAAIADYLVSHGAACRLAAFFRDGEDLLPTLG